MPGFFKLGFLKRLKGFTLIELLIVISIIGVLTGVSSVSYTKSQGKTRDTQRKNDLQTIKSALNLYYQQNSKYPPADMAAGTDYYSYNAQPWIPDISPTFINNLPKDPTQVSQNIFGNTLASLLKFDAVTTVYAGGGGDVTCGGVIGIISLIGSNPYSIGSVSVYCSPSGYTAAPWVTFSTCPDGTPTDPATATAQISGGEVISITVTYGGAGYTCQPQVLVGPPPGGEPAPTPTPTPYPTPPPAAGCSAVSSVSYYYCYTVNAQRNRYKIWARLENTTDSEVSTNSTATCFDTSPPSGTNLNYCVESE